jgi:hypothetical protein
LCTPRVAEQRWPSISHMARRTIGLQSARGRCSTSTSGSFERSAPDLTPTSTLIPAFTSDPDDDPIVFGALLAGADHLISDDKKHIVPQGEPREYEHEDRRLLAVTFDYLVTDLMPDIDWDEIDGGLLADALAGSRPPDVSLMSALCVEFSPQPVVLAQCCGSVRVGPPEL